MSRTLRFFTSLIAVWFIPVGASVWLLNSPIDANESTAPVKPAATARVGERVNDGFLDAILELTWSQPSPVRYHGPGGRVTSFPKRIPTVTGDTLFELNGVEILAQIGPGVPFYRDIDRSTNPAQDVDELDRILIELGYSSGSTLAGGRATEATVEAIRALNTAIGSPGDVFHWNTFIYFPTSTSIAKFFSYEIGDYITDGDPVAGKFPSLLAAKFEFDDSDPSRAGLLRSKAGFKIEYEGKPPIVVDHLDSNEGTLDALGRITEPPSDDVSTTTMNVRVSLASPERYGVVPSSAVVSSEESGGCLVLVADGEPRAFMLPDGYPLPGVPGTLIVPEVLINSIVALNYRGPLCG